MSKMTFYFSDLLPDFETFKAYCNDIPIKYTDLSAFDKDIMEHCYNLLLRRYGHANVRYTTPEAFYNAFAIPFDDEFKRYCKRMYIIGEAYKLTLEDFAELNRAISNYANNPNDEVSTPLAPLSYISSQTFMANISNKLQAYLVAIDTLPSNYDEEFLSHFRNLFINIIPNDIIVYEED